MTEVIASEFFEPVQDERYQLLTTQKVSIDGSSAQICIARKPAWNSPTRNGIVNYSSAPTQFRIYSSSDMRSLLSSFTFIVKGHASKMVNGVEVSVNYQRVGIEFDPASALIKNCYIRFNSNSELAEVYANSRYGTAHKMRILQTMSRQMIEQDDSIYFSPSFESSRDLLSGLSVETSLRSRRWLSTETTSNTAGGIIYHSRNLPLSHIFSCCSIPAYLDVHCIDIILELNKYDEIMFQSSNDTNANSYIIDDISLIIDQTKMSPSQASIELKDKKAGTNVQRMAYPYYEVLEQNYIRNAKVTVPSVENLQSVVFTFNSKIDGHGINSGQFFLNDISSYSVMLDNVSIMDLPVNIDVNNTLVNSELYYWFRQWCSKPYCTNFVPSIPCYEGFLQPLNSVSNPRVRGETYGLMCAKFWSSDNFHLSKPSQLEIMTNQDSRGTSNTTCNIILVKMRCFQINSDSTTESLN